MRPIRAVAVSALLSVGVVAGALVAHAPLATADPCYGAGQMGERNGHALCVHASERPPAGISLYERPSLDKLKLRRFGPLEHAATVPGRHARSSASRAFVAADATSSPSPSPTATTAPDDAGNGIDCIGDGVSGNRVQAIYAHASDVSDRYSSVVGMIRQYATDADYQIDVSAGQSGQGRRVRYVTNNCVLDVKDVTLSSGGDDTFSATLNDLQAQGYTRSDRHYLVWVDASVGICGLGQLYADDSPGADNANNSGPSYARVDSPCWGYAETHELLHTLGAVQNSAPHSTGAGHCIDTNDTMCYSDTSGATMETLCPSMPTWQVDCGLNDYFNAAPGSGTYLATHWDVASSSYLEGAPPPPTPPTIVAHVPTKFYAGNAVSVSATASVPAGRTFTISWSSSRSDCKLTHATGSASTFYCPVTAAGGGQVTARVNDSAGMSNTSTITYTLTIPSHARYTVATAGSNLTRISSGRRVTLTGKLRDASTLKPVIGMKISIYYRRSSSSSWRYLTSRSTGSSGTFKYTVRPTRTTYYMIVSWSTRTWRSDQSSSRRISVS